MNKKQKKVLARIIIAVVLMIILHFIPVKGIIRFLLYMVPYLVIGYDILKKAFKGIKNKQVFDENFLMAVATLGALALAVEHAPGALGGSRCLVAGFGRIGKALCLDLRALGAQVDCCARKPWDLAAIRALGCGPVTYDAIPGPYDMIFNTVPAAVLGEEPLSRQGPDTLLLELASAPGGICRRAAQARGLRLLDCPSLPGRFSPKASGELVKEAVYHILEERRKLS